MEIDVAPPRCVTCSKPMNFAGRISLPPEVIYQCESCRTEIWVGNAPRAATPMVPEQPRAQQQRQQQQKQQQQPQPEKPKE